MKKIFIYAAIIAINFNCSAQGEPAVKNSEIRLVTSTEPGKPLILNLTVLDMQTRKALKDIEIFVYHTNAKGDYENNSKGVARIHGSVITNDKGKVKFYTIFPRGYNDSPQGAHIHFRINAKGYKVDSPTLDFDTKENDKSGITANKVYLNSMEEKDGTLHGEAVIYIR